MADMYTSCNNNNNNINNATVCSSSVSPPPPPPENDDISLFVRQILLRATNSSSTSPAFSNKTMQSFDPFLHLPPDHQYPHPQLLPDPTRVSAADTCFPVNVASSVGGGDNDFEEYDCENEEEGYEGLMGEEPAKASSRNSSKRSRAAEVHNLSEKRRRSRINEKMKALQNLIPNSNKTDKASMLDEAIEYLKQLQLQVQMLTMRNGLSLYPMCIPGVLLQPNQLSQIRTSFHEGNEPLKMTSTPPVINPVPSTNLSLPNQFNNLKQPLPLGTSLSNFISSKTPFRLESSAHAQHKPFGLHTYSEGNCREDAHFQPLNADQSKTNIGMLKDLHSGIVPTSSLPFDSQASSSNDKAVETSNRRRS